MLFQNHHLREGINMNIAKVIGNDGVNVQLGFQNGTFITVPAQQIGFLAPIGMLIDVYENTQNGITVYQYVQHQGNFGGALEATQILGPISLIQFPLKLIPAKP